MSIIEGRSIWVTTDIGGSDADDYQSLVHLLMYANKVNIRGITAGVPRGKKSAIKQVKAIYKKDFRKYKWIDKGFPKPRAIKAYQGKSRPGDWSNTSEVKALVNESKKPEYSKNNPLVICAWGAATDIAAAVHNGLKKRNCFLVLIMGFHPNDWNGKQDWDSFNLLKNTGMRRIFVDSTMRGMYAGWDKNANKKWVANRVKPNGKLGEFFYNISATIDNGASGPYSIKMGDTPSIIWAMTTTDFDPTKSNWGGRYKLVKKNMWGALHGKAIGYHNGARTINRKAIMRDWRKQMKEIYG